METALFLLPGWEEKIISFAKLVSILDSKNIKVKIVDFPFFQGKTQPNHLLELEDFAEFVLKKIEQKKKQVVLFGHSFGGRVAIKLAANYPEKIGKLILCNAAGIKRISFKKIVFWPLAKIGRLFFEVLPLNFFAPKARRLLYQLAREKDYQQTSGNLRRTFQNVIAEDLAPLLPKIKAKTLINRPHHSYFRSHFGSYYPQHSLSLAIKGVSPRSSFHS